MSTALNIIKQLSEQQRVACINFIAPVFTDSKSVIVSVNGIRLSLKIDSGQSGWGVFQSTNSKTADFIRQADLFEISDYLSMLPQHDFILMQRVNDDCWVAYPKNTDVFLKKYGTPTPTLIYFVDNGAVFDEVRCGSAGQFFYVEHRNFCPEIQDYLSASIKKIIQPSNLKLQGLTNSHKVVYNSIYEKLEEANPVKVAEKKINKVLNMVGGNLVRLSESSKTNYLVEWRDSRGERVTTILNKDEARVQTAGYCLDGDDAKFDFQAIVGLKEARYNVKNY